MLSHVILAIKDLRNAVAHNKVVFDGRYIEFKKRTSLMNMLMQETNVQNIKCNTLLDDVILICFLLKNLGFAKEESKRIVNGIRKALSVLKLKLRNELYQKVTAGINPAKLNQLEIFIKKK